VLVLDEHEYLRQVELLAGDVVRAAAEEGWLTHGADAAEAPALHRAVNELASALAHWHFDGDGRLDPDREMLRLGGAAVITPGQTTAAQDTYDAGCERLGVVARDEGWALWHTWDRPGPAVHRGHHPPWTSPGPCWTTGPMAGTCIPYGHDGLRSLRCTPAGSGRSRSHPAMPPRPASADAAPA
jgi:hypothetical protein